MSTYDGLVLIDVADPLAPRAIGSPVRGPGHPIDIAAGDGYTYVAYWTDDESPGGIEVVDVQDRDQPHLVASLELTYNTTSLALAGSALVVAANGNMWVVDVRDSRHPIPVAVIGPGPELAPALPFTMIPGQRIDDVVAIGTTVWVGQSACECEPGRIQAIDVSDPLGPRLIGSVSGRPALAIAADGGRLIALPAAAFSNRLDVYDIARPAQPAFGNSLDLVGPTRDLWLAERWAYAGAFLPYGQIAGCHVVDAGDASRPRVATTIPVSQYDILYLDSSGL